MDRSLSRLSRARRASRVPRARARSLGVERVRFAGSARVARSRGRFRAFSRAWARVPTGVTTSG
eukprot:29587-Pelagococcus_subviridis.AAC.10